jgi:hypothetical protein
VITSRKTSSELTPVYRLSGKASLVGGLPSGYELYQSHDSDRYRRPLLG